MVENKSITESKKWMISLLSAFVFMVIASPQMYQLTGALFSKLNLVIEKNGCPNLTGLLLHTVVFAVIIRLLML